MADSPKEYIEVADYLLPDGISDAEVVERLRCPLTRICNIYSIKDANGEAVPFRPNQAQCVVLYWVYIRGINRIAIPKARQLGFSTLIAIIALDETHFSDNKQASVVDQTQGDASEKLDKVRFAYEQLAHELKDAVVSDSKRELGWANGSVVQAGKNARGGTNQVIHISEWGPIAFEDPARSEEIKTGAIPSASGENAKVFAESTHKGGKGGDWYDLIKQSLETPEAHRTALDFKVLFFPWQDEPRYTLKGDSSQITPEVRQYLAKKEEQLGYKFTEGQALFYFKQRQKLGKNIYREFPTTIEECWMAPFPGAIYSPDVDKARMGGRISPNVAYYEGFPVYTAWDIGAPANQKVWIFQAIGDRLNFLEALTGGDDCKMPGDWAKRLKEKSYSYGGHFIPHDGEILWRQQLAEAGLKGVVVLPAQVWIWDDINDALASFSRCSFNSITCADGLDALEAFRSKQEADGVTIRDIPVHDWASHFSNAFGLAHKAIRLGMLVDRSAIPAKPFSGKPQVKTGIRDPYGAGGALQRRALR